MAFDLAQTSAPLTGLAVVAMRMIECVRLISYPKSPPETRLAAWIRVRVRARLRVGLGLGLLGLELGLDLGLESGLESGLG